MKKLLMSLLILVSINAFSSDQEGSGGTPATTNSTPVVTCYQVKVGEDGSSGVKTVCVVQAKSDQEGSGGNQ